MQKDRGCRTAPLGDFPPSTSTQGTLRYLINNTVPFRAPDVLVLRSRTLYVYLIVHPNPLFYRYLGCFQGSLYHGLWSCKVVLYVVPDHR